MQLSLLIFRRVLKITVSDCQLRHVCLCVRPSVHRYEPILFQRTNFNEILNLWNYRKSVGILNVSLQYDKNNEYFTRRPTYIYGDILRSSSQNEKCFRQKLSTRSQHTFQVSFTFFFLKSCCLWVNVVNMVQADWPQMTI